MKKSQPLGQEYIIADATGHAVNSREEKVYEEKWAVLPKSKTYIIQI